MNAVDQQIKDVFKFKLENIKNSNPIDQYLIQERMAEQLRDKIANLVLKKEASISEVKEQIE